MSKVSLDVAVFAGSAALFGLLACAFLADQNSYAHQQLRQIKEEVKAGGLYPQSLPQTRSLFEGERERLAGKQSVGDQPFPPIILGDPPKETLAQKNNNPLNIKLPSGGGRWKGQIGTDKFGHAVFMSREYGLRAGAMVLRSYAKRHKISTIASLVERFAEGNHESYKKALCKKLRVREDEEINILKRLPELLRAMVRQESGEDLPESFFAPYDVLASL